MKYLTIIICLILLSGCATGALQVNPDDLQTLQMTSESGCVTANIAGSSGVIGGSSRVIVTWGELDISAINWCIGK